MASGFRTSESRLLLVLASGYCRFNGVPAAVENSVIYWSKRLPIILKGNRENKRRSIYLILPSHQNEVLKRF